MILKRYSNIKELTDLLEEMFNSRVVDGWRENRYWVSILDRGILKIKNLLPV